MDSLLPLLLLLSITSIAGFIYRAKKGVIKKAKRVKISEKEIGAPYGDRLTILQFSTTFCSSCRAAKALISDVVKGQEDIAYYEVDAESNLDLVRKVDVRSTPTTLFLDRSGFEIARATGTPKRDQLIKVVASL